MPSRAYTSFLLTLSVKTSKRWHLRVNALSGLYLISTLRRDLRSLPNSFSCQCPLGLIPHFYSQLPLYCATGLLFRVNALSGLYLISTENNVILKPFEIDGVSMPSRAYTSFLRYPFKNLGFMRFPEPVFAGIYQNILTTAVLRAC